MDAASGLSCQVSWGASGLDRGKIGGGGERKREFQGIVASRRPEVSNQGGLREMGRYSWERLGARLQRVDMCGWREDKVGPPPLLRCTEPGRELCEDMRLFQPQGPALQRWDGEGGQGGTNYQFHSPLFLPRNPSKTSAPTGYWTCRLTPGSMSSLGAPKWCSTFPHRSPPLA